MHTKDKFNNEHGQLMAYNRQKRPFNGFLGQTNRAFVQLKAYYRQRRALMDIKAKLGRERSQLKAYARNIQQRAKPNFRHISGRIDL